MASVAGFGVTVMEASGPATTVTVVLCVSPPQATVMVLVPGVAPAVNLPVVSMVPPPVTDQVSPWSVVTGVLVRVPVAVSSNVPFTAMVCVVGDRVSVDRVSGPVASSHAVTDSPTNARAARMRNTRLYGATAREARLLE